MAAEIKKEIALEIAHVLFIDIVAYSKMTTDEQRAAVEKLSQIVQSTDEFQKADSENKLLKLATGDGMALIFYHSPEDPPYINKSTGDPKLSKDCGRHARHYKARKE